MYHSPCLCNTPPPLRATCLYGLSRITLLVCVTHALSVYHSPCPLSNLYACMRSRAISSKGYLHKGCHFCGDTSRRQGRGSVVKNTPTVIKGVSRRWSNNEGQRRKWPRRLNIPFGQTRGQKRGQKQNGQGRAAGNRRRACMKGTSAGPMAVNQTLIRLVKGVAKWWSNPDSSRGLKGNIPPVSSACTVPPTPPPTPSTLLRPPTPVGCAFRVLGLGLGARWLDARGVARGVFRV